jgi:transcription initiation factor IIE alpha subunit
MSFIDTYNTHNKDKDTGRLDDILQQRMNERFYHCQICSIEVNEEDALSKDFACPECGSIYELIDNRKIIESLEKIKNRYKHNLEAIKNELEEMHEKSRKRKDRIQKKD